MRKAALSKVKRWLMVALALPLLLPVVASAQAPSGVTLPQDAIQLSGAEPAMGEHWARPQDMPLGPIYLVWQGEVIGIEYMFDLSMLHREAVPTPEGEEVFYGLDNLSVGARVDHLTVGYMYPGHPGFMTGHYDIHLYFITPEERAQVGMPPPPEMAALGEALAAQLRAPGPVFPTPSSTLPEHAVQLSPVIPGMGAHWLIPGETPAVPPPNALIYLADQQNRIVGLEPMWNHDLMSGAKVTLPPGAFPEMPQGGDLWVYEINFMPVGMTIDHMGVDYVPEGHPVPGFDTWHFDLHLYSITPEERGKVMPGG